MVDKQNKLYIEGKEAMQKQQAIDRAKIKVQEAADFKKDIDEQKAVAEAAAQADNVAKAKAQQEKDIKDA